MKLDTTLSDFLLYLKHEQGATLTTFKQYQSYLHHFLNWIETNGYPDADLSAFHTASLRRFLYYLSEKGLRPRTVRGYFHPLRSFGVFLVREGHLEENPAASVTLPKLDAAQRKTVSDEEIRLLMAACERQRNPARVALCRAVLAVLVYGGLRRQELCDLHLTDADIEEKALLVRCGKGKKSRRIFVCDDCIAALQEWIALRPKDCKHPYLFALDRNRRVHHAGIASIVEEVKAIAGLSGHEGIKPHSLRHAAATRLMRNGADLKTISAFLGHSDLRTTNVYLHTDEERLRDVRELTALRPQKPQREEDDGKVIYLPRHKEKSRERLRLRRTAIE